ncbi:Dynein heavy chain, N-terminal region 2/Hydrolytic ATP binding site of dynein motor region/AAA domain (dynein-related subfamily)/P-loop containing dynein motor region/P-loop containing dynein motor region D4/Microtubule-binding stalk of dynein motor/ATP-binding dynein motor region/Dynein heavy chain region D6 P-loop domain/Dynein heavy chain AAA lid domain/Dynein heavy chain C-terminal domain containing protein, putative [Leishmania lindenbergi]|uniref:Cytoplasmic dynein 2 heavy chain 1 n=1 Tax=Leishmania lindenbergi TaxID=651832 RepID=A0AAW3A9E2_9TRYP
MSGLVSVESQLVSTAQRHFHIRCGHVQSRRGDGWLLLSFAPFGADTRLELEVQALCSALVRDVTGNGAGSVRLTNEDEETHFGKLADKSLSFTKLLRKSGVSLGAGSGPKQGDDSAGVDELPKAPGVVEMVEMLYHDVVAESKHGARAIVQFPFLLCPQGTRCDVALQGEICVKAFSRTASAVVAETEVVAPAAAVPTTIDDDTDDEAEPFGDATDGAQAPRRFRASKVEAEATATTPSPTVNGGTCRSLNDSMLQSSYSVAKLPDGELAKVWIDTRAWAQALASNAGASVEAELPPTWRSKAFSLAEAPEVLGIVHRTLAHYWNEKHTTNTDRVKSTTLSLLSIVSGDLREYLRGKVELYGPDWQAPWRMPAEELSSAVDLCKQWNRMVVQLVRQDWVGWESGMFHDESFDVFAQRLHTVLRVRETFASVQKLSKTTPPALHPEHIFAELNALDMRGVAATVWESRVAQFEKEFSFAEPGLRSCVKQLFQSPVSDVQLRFLQQHRALLRRSGVRSAVTREMDGVAAHLFEHLNRVYARFENNSRRATTPLQKLRAAKGCVAECVMVPEEAAKVFGTTDALTEKVTAHAHELIHKATQEEAAIMKDWCASVESAAKKMLELPDAVVVSTIGDPQQQQQHPYLLMCTVHMSLRKFMQEVRNVRAWLSDAEMRHDQEQYDRGSGDRRNSASQDVSAAAASQLWRLSSSAESTICACEHLCTAALRTQKCVANHNTVIAQILPCTRRMLAPAIEKSMLQVLYADTAKRAVAVANYQELEGVNLRFQNTIEALSNANRQVRRFHEEFGQHVIALMDVDLTSHMEQWRVTVDDLRSKMEDFLARQHLSDHEDWRRHWDGQIYKALEHQYRRGLERLHEEMTEFKVELVLRQGTVHFKPSFEAIREAYYVKLREFVSVPLRFRGLQPKRQDANTPYELYPLMPLTNNDRIVTVHAKAIELFAKLNRVRKAFRSHIIVGLCGIHGSPDLDSIADAWMEKLAGQISQGFRTVEEHREKMGKIENVMKIDCFAISTVPVRASIEEHLHRLEEALLNGMRRHIQTSLNDIDEFVLRVSNIVERQPTTMDEVGEANKRYKESLEQISIYERKLDAVLEQNKELRNHVGASIDVGATRARWDHLKDAMASHTKVMEAAVLKMRVSLNSLIQRFLKDVERFADGWKRQRAQLMRAFAAKETKTIRTVLLSLKDQLHDLADLESQAKELESKCEFFGQVKPVFGVLWDTKKDVQAMSATWALCDAFEEELGKLRAEDWLTFRAHTCQFEDFCKAWRSKLNKAVAEGSGATAKGEAGEDKRRKSNKDGGGDTTSAACNTNDPIATYLLNMVTDWGNVVPLLKFVRGEGWMTEHWNEMFRLLNIPKETTSTSLTFGLILDHHLELLAKEGELKHLHARAHGEIQLREALQDMRRWALEAGFSLTAPTESVSKVRLITDWKEMMTQVTDNQALVNSLKDSPFFAHFADEAAGWESKLISLSQSLTLLNHIQRRWAYLEPIFARGALPHEQARFKRVDKEFIGILREIEADPRVMSLANQTDVNERLKGILEQVERCQKSLIEFLEAKRNKLPRFYFISDEDMLEMLGHSQSPSVIQVHLKKLFMGIHSVTFSSDNASITHMISADGEKVALRRPVVITSSDVEDWLLALDASMKETLHELLISCVKQPDATTKESIINYPSQILQVAQGVHFAREAEEAIIAQSLNQLLISLRQRLDRLTAITPELDALHVLKVKALIFDTIHNIEVVELLLKRNVCSVDQWWWKKQLRYRMSTDDTHYCTVHMADTQFEYAYEYQGNAAKLVHTPLTDRCYLVLTKGMDLGYGGNPYGPAGTGKTESVKALGSAMGRQVLVFNCDEGIDFKAMGRIFVGIVKCGAWGCFDEFNRLKIDQLSAISQMIQVIQQALKNREANCMLLNNEITVNANAGIFVTLNPAGKGYGGRTQLPDNLKQLFREVAMSVPDNELITSTVLFSEGFTHARALAKSIVALYRLCGQLMSRQQHYDWGLRPLKAVLRLGGTLLQRWKKEHAGAAASQKAEEELMLQSLNINTLSKLTFGDARVFQGLLRDIFPGAESRDITYNELEVAVASAVKDMGLQPIPAQQKKVLQLYEALQQRTGVVLVGPSGSGKSTLLSILRKALQTMNITVPMHVMNPKAMPRRRLLGYMDADTREWYDGVLTVAARDVVKQSKEARPWVLCDGDIDPEWIESLNSVLDDNKLLTMPNGVRIQFGANVNFIFETHSLEYASPATVSRMGVLFFSEKDVQLEAVVESGMAFKSLETGNVVRPLILKYVFAAIDEAQRLNDFSVTTTRMGLLQTCLLHVMLTKNAQDFAYSLVRGLCACLNAGGAAKLASWIYTTMGQKSCSDSRPFDSYWDDKLGRAVEFTADLSTPVTPADLLAGRPPVVQTVEVKRLISTLQPLLEDRSCKAFFVVGPEGCGKGALLDYVFSTRPTLRTTTINCSAQTNSTHVIQKIEQACVLANTNAGPVYRPREGERLVIILKNVNLPKADRYGTVELHSFLQQLILYKGFYNQDLEWVGVDRVQIVASMNPTPSAGRYPVTPRLLALASIVTVSYPSRTSLVQVYTTYWAALLRQTNIGQGKDYEKGALLAQFMLHVYDKVRHQFEGEEYMHFSFSPRHLTKWVTNVLLYHIDTRTTLPAVLAYEASRIFTDCLPRAEDRRQALRTFSEQLATIGYAMPAREERFTTMFVTWFDQENGAADVAAAGEQAQMATAADGDEEENTDNGARASRGGEAEGASAAAATGPRAVLKLVQKKYDDVRDEVEHGLLRYSREFKELHVPLIPEILCWVTYVDRVLTRPGGHLLLVGSTGVGRRNAVLLAAYQQRREVVSLNMTQDYHLKHFRLDLRGFIQRATVQNTPLVLLIEDHHIVNATFLEYVNSLLSSGEVPGLFSQEEMETMFSAMRDDAANDGHMGAIYAYFVERLQRNLRIALIMDHRHELFLIRLHSNPALMSKCELLWMGTWSGDMTKTICKTYLADEIAALEANPANKGFHVHREVNAIHEGMGDRSTPHDVQVVLNTFRAILGRKSSTSKKKMERLEAGLAKLKEAEESVEKVKRDVAEKKKDVERMQKAADKALNEIQSSMEESQEQRDEAAILQEQLKEEQTCIAKSRGQVEEELGGIKPMMEAARDAVSSIRSEQLSEIRSLPSPPEAIRVVLEGVLALLGVNDVSWQSMRQFLGERGAKQRILDFEVRSVTPDIRHRVEKLLRDRASFFKPEVIQRASVAAAPIAEWVKAMLEYSSIMERISPLTEQLEKLETNQKDGAAKLEHLQKRLKKIDAKVKELREGFSEKCKEAERLRGKLQAAEEELGRAKDLLDKLSGEKDRWATEAAAIREANNTMPKRALVAAAFLTYLGQETEDGRRRFLKTWCDRLGFPEVLEVTHFLRTEGDLLQYKSEGLSTDGLSLQNAVVMLDTEQTPLVIDPANKVVEWMREHLRRANTVVETISLHDGRFTHTLELAIRFGKTLIVTEVADIAPLLYTVLRRDLISAGAKRVVQVGNKTVEWNDSFRIMLFSRQSGLRLSPGAAALVTEVNFSVTSLGLEGQLLGVTLQRERPELEKQKVELLENEESLQLQLSKLEERLLSDLAESQGNLLENAKLITSLNEVKMQAYNIQRSLARSHVLQVELDEKREVYRPFAHHGALLFFLIRDMEVLNHMYQYGINDYIALFTQTLKTYQGDDEARAKVQELIASFTKACFHNVTRGLLKKDRIAFGLHVLHGLWPAEYPQDLWGALVGTITNVKAVSDSPLPQWAPLSSKIKYASILSSAAGQSLAEKWQVGDPNRWAAVMNHTTPESELVPPATNSNRDGSVVVSDMEKLLWINTFRPDRASATALQIILSKLGLTSLAPVMSLEKTILSSSPTTPVLLITSSGADPSMEIQDVATHLVGKERFVELALGGGQTDNALQQVRRCAVQGDWLLLKNLHLVLDWASVLENELCSMPPPSTDFRLIITTEQHDLFPSVLLRMSNKVAVEAPPGVKQNLLRTYSLWDSAFLAAQSQAGARLLFGLSWLHAVMQERRTYVPQGWSKYYEFSPADLKAATDVLTSLAKQPQLDWVTLTGFLESCLYGGRLENAVDEKVLELLIQTYFNEDVLLKDKSPVFPGVTAANAGSLDRMVAMLQASMPDVDPPALLCMCDNADRTVQEDVAHATCESLRELCTKETTEQTSGEKWRERLRPALEVWKGSGIAANGLPQTMSSHTSDPEPMEVFFISELNLIAALIKDLSVFFDTLHSVAEGVLIPDSALRAEATELMNGRMPSRWLDRMDGPQEAKMWLALLWRKYNTTRASVKVPFSTSVTYDLSSLLRPQTFFNALRQHTARATKAPLADLVLVATMDNVVHGGVTVKVAAKSLVMQGAAVAGDGCLAAVQANSPSSVQLSMDITASWVPAGKVKHSSQSAAIPVYADAERRTMIFPLRVRCAGEAEATKTALNGVACYLVNM